MRIAKIAKWYQPDAYKEMMRKAEIPEEEWPNRLLPLLTGKALQAHTHQVAEEDKKLFLALGGGSDECLGSFPRSVPGRFL